MPPGSNRSCSTTCGRHSSSRSSSSSPVVAIPTSLRSETDSATGDRPHENAAETSEHRAHAKRNSAQHRRAVSTRAVDHAGPADLLCAGFHIPPAHSRRDFIRDEGRAVIGDPQLELTGVNAEVDVDPFRASVSANVVERLLREAVERFVRAWNQRVAWRQRPDRERHLRAGAVSECVALAAHRVLEPAVLHRRRLQLIDQRVHFN